MAKTSEDYVKTFAHCPVCNSTDIEGYSFDVIGNEAFQSICCNECNSQWADCYKLIGFADLEVSNNG